MGAIPKKMGAVIKHLHKNNEKKKRTAKQENIQ
jgi:hypothetical protein